jgi:hypothetical protein
VRGRGASRELDGEPPATRGQALVRIAEHAAARAAIDELLRPLGLGEPAVRLADEDQQRPRCFAVCRLVFVAPAQDQDGVRLAVRVEIREREVERLEARRHESSNLRRRAVVRARDREGGGHGYEQPAKRAHLHLGDG